MPVRQAIARVFLCFVVFLVASPPVLGGVHLWRVKEVFSNADGTIQFIEIATCCNSTGENNLTSHVLSSGSNSFMFPTNVPGSTLNKHVLLGTTGFAALPGAPAPDFTIADNFFSTSADTITFSVYDTLVFAAGQLPTNGTSSLNKDPEDPTDTIVSALNSPTNYSDATGTVNASSGPPGVPDGTGGTNPMTVSALVPDGSSLEVTFDTASCMGASQHHLLYGQRSGLPAAPGGTFTLLGSLCNIGNTSPYSWLSAPVPVDGSNLIWFVMVTTDAAGLEGSWGVDGLGNERVGPGNNGSSGTCALVKSTSNSCGHTP